MKSPDIHIVAFDVPYPPNYGGVIDIYYKVSALTKAGYKVRLHCFTDQRSPASELSKICESVYYYPRKTGWKSNFSFTPYIIKSRSSEELLRNLLNDNAPVLLEGLHTCALLREPALKNRILVYRESNIEHHYYFHLLKADQSWFKKVYFLIEMIRLRVFQHHLSGATMMLAVSTKDQQYLKARFPGKPVNYLPSFHGRDIAHMLPGFGRYVLYHGNLSVSENYKAANYIVTRIWTNKMPRLVIAGQKPPDWLHAKISEKPNVMLVENPENTVMEQLITHAHIHLLITFQATGLKLKLLNALFRGRFCLVNKAMVAGTDLGQFCQIASKPIEFRKEVDRLFGIRFEEHDAEIRKTLLEEIFSDTKNCKRLSEHLSL
jgi:hypothetical protein